jgi:hypothetical protein
MLRCATGTAQLEKAWKNKRDYGIREGERADMGEEAAGVRTHYHHEQVDDEGLASSDTDSQRPAPACLSRISLLHTQ